MHRRRGSTKLICPPMIIYAYMCLYMLKLKMNTYRMPKGNCGNASSCGFKCKREGAIKGNLS